MLRNTLVLLVVLIAFSSCDFTSHEEYYNKGLLYEKRGDYKEALYYMNKAVQKKPEDRQALFQRAFYHSKLGDDPSSIADGHRILEFDPNNTLVLFNLAQLYGNDKEFSKATEYYSKALATTHATQLDTTSGKYNLEFRDLYEDRDSDYAVSKVKILAKRGKAYLDDQKIDEAIADFKSLLEAEFSESYAHHYLGEAYLAKKDSVQACQSFVAAAQLGSKISKKRWEAHCKSGNLP